MDLITISCPCRKGASCESNSQLGSRRAQRQGREFKIRAGEKSSGRNGKCSEHLLRACQACDGKALRKSSAVKERKLEVMPFGKQASEWFWWTSVGCHRRLSTLGLWSCWKAAFWAHTFAVATRANARSEFYYFRICCFFKQPVADDF